ncbi:hypothetical protein MNBD_NITROSPINAE01-843 [hydrothermal vent metagenome]|uniref:Uncharacterized protein n=1 Tax=hydrothermal vent metagenome TaxID=652676 RepID=A0A3B1BNY3_9ZZZZ
MQCIHCEAVATVITIDADCDLKQPVCERCREAHDYHQCELCKFHYAPRYMQNDDDTPTCIYCVGKRDFPFYEDLDT